MALGYAESSAGMHPSAYYLFQPGPSNAFQAQAQQVIQLGAAPYGGSRWGDYSGTVADPTTTGVFWTIGEATLSSGAWGTWWTEVVPLAATLPATPLNFTAMPDRAGPITLSWSSVTGASEYDVYRQNSDGTWPATPLFTTPSTSTTVQNTGVTAGTVYTYRLTAKNAIGESTPSITATATATVNPLFQDNFNTAGSFPGSNWTVAGTGSTWSQVVSGTQGVLSQTSVAAGDPKKAVATSVTTASPSEEIFARVRVDAWQDGEYARAGIGLLTDPGTGQGYNIVVRDRVGVMNAIQFLDDGVIWGNAYTLATPLSTGTWSDFRLLREGGVLDANVWPDGTPEPATWQYVQAGWTDRTTGSPALNGGSAGTFTPLGQGFSSATASFDDVAVTGG
jgi:hypothetical protein